MIIPQTIGHNQAPYARVLALLVYIVTVYK